VKASEISRRLLRHGLVVFLLGLLSGLAMMGPPGLFKNLRLALSSHLVGVTGGLFLIAMGLMIPRLRLSSGALAATFWMAVYGAYGNWGGSMLAAIFGASTMTPVSGGVSPEPAAGWQEALVGLILTTSGTGTLAACLMLIWGLSSKGDEADDA
jgi:(hydroxyamino)benzene mutase